MDIEAAKQQQLEAFNAGYIATRWGNPVSVTLSTGLACSFATDQTTQDNLQSYAVMFLALDPPALQVPLVDATGTTRMLAWADVQALIQAIAQQSLSAWNRRNTLTAQLEETTTIEDVLKVQW